MQKNIKFNFLHNKFSRFMFFCILLFSVVGFVFAKSNFIISPVEGEWSNYQSVIIDVPAGSTAFYSFTGDNPLYSGFAYESPVLLELEGKINLKVVILNSDNSVIEESVDFSVNKIPLEVPFYSESQTDALVLVKDKNISIPSYMRYSLTDFQEPYLKGRTLTVDSKNSLEQILPLIIQNKNNLYRFMLKIPAVSYNQSEQNNFVNNEILLDDAMEDDFTVRRIEKKLSHVPFTLEFTDWSEIKITTSENIYVCLDDDIWQTGSFVLNCNRDVAHTLSWIDLTGLNPEEFIPEQFKVFYTNIPAKPSLIVEQDKTKIAKISLTDKNYLMYILQNTNFVKSNLRNNKDVFVIDTIFGNDLNTNVSFEVFYDGIYQGELSTDVFIDKQPPRPPKVVFSNSNFFVREPVELKFNTEEEIFYVLKTKELSSLDLKNLELEMNKNFAVDLSSAVELTSDTLILFEDSKNAIFFNLAYFSKDKFGNISEIEYYQVLLDSYNYYIESNSNIVNYVQDGSVARPFNSISQLLPYLESNNFFVIHLEGNFSNVPSLKFTSPCEITSEKGARLSFANDSFITVENTSLKISNCVLEQNFVNTDPILSQQNLFKLDKSSLIIDNCETVSLYKNNGSVIFANNSDIQILNSGMTIQSKVFASIFNILNSNLSCNNTRLSGVSDSAIALTMNLGNLSLENSQIQVNGLTSKFYELFGVSFSINNNKFLYKNFSKDMESFDVFSKIVSYKDNQTISF